jgi:hypothetical protein
VAKAVPKSNIPQALGQLGLSANLAEHQILALGLAVASQKLALPVVFGGKSSLFALL